ncbi:8822_t:CDS:1 [Scutellospora calospora]|uniref:8822_t:CDS:1 n=1 Tax=Scutellospora calospora TaxID=85575 RepID=A0ACA9L908_9GLOM|nr:8822_t:CDS:1 [Scutellospora calospora]
MNEYQSSFLVNNICVFINSGNNPMIKSQVIDDSRQLIELPFPPVINSRDLVILHPDGRVPNTPNAFIIYRKQFVETARAGGYNLPMNIISSMASRSWEQESEEVKNEYKRIAKEAFNYRNELFPKVKPQRKRDQWRTVSFDKPSTRKVRMPKSIKTTNNPTKHQQLNKSKVTPELPSDLSDIDMNSPIFNLDLFADWADFLRNQNAYPSSDLSTTSSNYNSPNINDFLNLETSSSTHCFDLPIQTDQQVSDDIINNFLFVGENQSYIYDNQYELGIFDTTNKISEINSYEIFNILNMQISDNLTNSIDQLFTF